MRLVQATKASHHAKFYSLSTDTTTIDTCKKIEVKAKPVIIT